MADHRIGKIFVELDLDASRYLKSQRVLQKEAQHGAEILEKNFKNLGIKSGATFDLMRAQAAKSFEAIKKSSKSTTNDIIRAEKAKAEKIRRINEQQYGHTISMFERIKKNWLAVTATIVAASYAIRTLTNITMDTIRVASDLQEVSSKFNVVFKGQEGAAISWSKTLVDSYAMSTRESKQYLSSVQDLLVPMGMAAGAAGKMSFEVVKLAADLGSFNNMPTARVMADIESALVGNFETMKKYGVVLNATIVQEKALAMGLAMTKGALTAGDKAQAAYALMVEGSAAAIGDMARTSDDYANQLKQLHANIEDFKALLGSELLPVATEVVSIMNDWVKANEDLIKQNLEDAVDKSTISIKGIVAIYNSLPDGVMGAAGYGIVGRLLTGSTPIGTAVALIALLNAQLAIFNMNLGAISKRGLELNEQLRNYWDVLIGKRDWDTGELKDINEQFKEMAGNWEMVVTQFGSGWIKKEDLDDFANWLEGANKDVEEFGDSGAKAFALAQIAAANANKELKKYYKELDKCKSAMDRVTLAALPKYERALESIRREYEELNKIIEENAEKANYSTEEIAELHAQLFERMMDDVGKFAEGFAKDVRGNVEETEKATDEISELWTNAMDRVQSLAADTFENILRGKIDSFKDFFKSFCDILLRYWAELMAKMTMFDLFGTGKGPGWGGFFGGIFGGTFSKGKEGASSVGGWLASGFSKVFGFSMPTLGKALGLGFISYLAGKEIFGSSTAGLTATGGAAWGSAFGPMGTALGFVLGGLLGKKNLKRSYLTREYTYGYDLAGGWSETGMEETKEKRHGEKFRKSAEEMSASIVDMLNNIDTAVSDFLESIDKTWVDKWKVAMMELGDLDFVFKISAEDQKEFEEDWEASFEVALTGIINPVLEKATELMLEAFTEEIESPRLQAAKAILKDSVQGYLDDSIASVYEAFTAELPTTYEEFEAYMENLGVGMEDAKAVLEYLNAIADIMSEISLMIELHGESEAVKTATRALIDINQQFDQFAEELSAIGVDLSKYTELEQARSIAIMESVEAMSSAGISGEDLARAIQYMAEEMEAAGHSIEEVAQAVHDATLGILESIDEIYKRHNEYGKTFAEILSEKYGFDFTGWDYEDWAAANQQMYDDFLAQYEAGYKDYADYLTSMGWTTEMLQDWRNFGAYLEDLWEQAVSSGEAFATSVGDAGRDFADMIRGAGAGLGSGATEMQHGAIVTRPTYSLIGEAGYPEVVLPLGGGHKLKAQLENGSGSQQEVTITIPLTVVTEDGRTLKQETIKETLSQIKERSGRREFVIHATGIKQGR